MSLQIRNITAEELEPFRRVEEYAFGSYSSDPIDPNYLQNVNYDNRIGAFKDERVVATFSNLPFKQSVRGVWKDMGGVAGVACLPEYRRQGIVQALVLNGFTDMLKKGQVVSALNPFRESFYAKFGYVLTRGVFGVEVDSVAFARYMSRLNELPEGWKIVRDPAVEMRPEYLDYVQAHVDLSSMAIAPDLSESHWLRRRKKQQMVRIMNGRTTEALALYEAKGFAEDGTLEVREMYWRSRSGRDLLFAFFALHREQMFKIRFKVPAGTNFQQWITQPPTPFKLSLDHDALMVRIIDVVGALAGLPAAVDGTFTFHYHDRFIDSQEGVYTLVAQNGRLQAHKQAPPADVTITTEGLTALAYGVLPVAEIEHRGWLTGLNDEARQLLEAWFPERPLFNPYFF